MNSNCCFEAHTLLMWVNYFIHTSVAVLSGSNFLQAWFNRELHIDLCEFQWKEVKIAHLLSLSCL